MSKLSSLWARCRLPCQSHYASQLNKRHQLVGPEVSKNTTKYPSSGNASARSSADG